MTQNSPPESIFHLIASYLPPNGRMVISFSENDSKEKRMTGTITCFEKDKLLYKPAVLRGTYDELKNGFWGQGFKYLQNIIGKINNVKSLEEDLAKKEKEIKTKIEKLKETVPKDKNRMKGAVNSSILEIITTTTVSDDSFKNALKESNMMTLTDALHAVAGMDNAKGRFKKLDTEYKKVTGQSAFDIGIDYELMGKSDSVPPDTEQEDQPSQQSLFDNTTKEGE